MMRTRLKSKAGKQALAITLGLCLLSVAVLGLREALASEGFQNVEVAVLITSADMPRVNEGSIIKYYPNAVLSHHSLFKNKWMLLLDPDDVHMKPLPIALRDSTMSLNALSILTPLISSWAQLPAASRNNLTLVPVNGEDPNNKFEFSPDKLTQLYLAKTANGGGFQPITPSVSLVYGNRALVKKEYDLIQSNQAALYGTHFEKIPMRMNVVKERPGRPDQRLAEVEGLYLVKHRMGGTGYFILPGAPGEPASSTTIVNVDEMKRDGDPRFGLVSFEVDAYAFNKQIVAPSLQREDYGRDNANLGDSLTCVIPSDAAERDLTACRDKGTANTKLKRVIVGALPQKGTENQKPVRFWLEEQGDDVSYIRVELTVMLNENEAPAYQPSTRLTPRPKPHVEAPVPPQTAPATVDGSKPTSGDSNIKTDTGSNPLD